MFSVTEKEAAKGKFISLLFSITLWRKDLWFFIPDKMIQNLTLFVQTNANISQLLVFLEIN